MPRGVYDRNKGAANAAPSPEPENGVGPVTEVAPNETTPKMVAVKLLKHYAPIGKYEIVGYDRPRIVAKDAGGREVVRQEAAFIAGEIMPPPHPGVGYEGKIWAGTTVKLPRDEAKTLYESKRAERSFDD